MHLQCESHTSFGQSHGRSGIDDGVFGEVSVQGEALHFRLSGYTPGVVDSPTWGAVKAAFYCTQKSNIVALLELARRLPRTGRDNGAGGFMANSDGVLPQNKTLVVWLEQHYVGMAERGACDLDEDLMVARFGHGDFV